jgi:hypothetical protein
MLTPLPFDVSGTDPETLVAGIICFAGAAIGHLPGHMKYGYHLARNDVRDRRYEQFGDLLK